MKAWPTTNGWPYSSPSTVSVNTLPNCWTLTLLVVNAVSLSFQPDLVLSLCCVSTDTDWGFVVLGAVGFSLHVASKRRPSGSGSLRLTMGNSQRVYRRLQVLRACSTRIDTRSKQRASTLPQCLRESLGTPTVPRGRRLAAP